MKKILNLAQYQRLYSDVTANNKEEKKERINHKARNVARPILSYIVDYKIIPCYKKAETDRALEQCYNNYLSDCQQLTFGTIISCTGTPEKTEKRKAEKNYGKRERRSNSGNQKNASSGKYLS